MTAIRRVRRKTIPVEAIQLTPETIAECERFAGATYGPDACGVMVFKAGAAALAASHGDWLLRDGTGTVTKCSPKLFAERFEDIPVAGKTDGLVASQAAVAATDVLRSRLCGPHREEAKQMAFGAWRERDAAAGCHWCLREGVDAIRAAQTAKSSEAEV